MTKTDNKLDLNMHRKLGIQYFNKSWDLIDKKDKRTPEEDELMLHYTHTSKLHWTESECPKVNHQRGDWQISRVYSILNRHQSALIYAKLCLDNTENPTKENEFKDFDVAYAYEAMARASAIAENKDDFVKYNKLASEAGEKIAGEEDKKMFMSDLSGGPWNGMK